MYGVHERIEKRKSKDRVAVVVVVTITTYPVTMVTKLSFRKVENKKERARETAGERNRDGEFEPKSLKTS